MKRKCFKYHRMNQLWMFKRRGFENGFEITKYTLLISSSFLQKKNDRVIEWSVMSHY